MSIPTTKPEELDCSAVEPTTNHPAKVLQICRSVRKGFETKLPGSRGAVGRRRVAEYSRTQRPVEEHSTASHRGSFGVPNRREDGGRLGRVGNGLGSDSLRRTVDIEARAAGGIVGLVETRLAEEEGGIGREGRRQALEERQEVGAPNRR